MQGQRPCAWPYPLVSSFPARLATARFVLPFQGTSPRQQGELHFFSFCMPTCMAGSIAPLPHAKATDVPHQRQLATFPIAQTCKHATGRPACQFGRPSTTLGTVCLPALLHAGLASHFNTQPSWLVYFLQSTPTCMAELHGLSSHAKAWTASTSARLACMPRLQEQQAFNSPARLHLLHPHACHSHPLPSYVPARF